jgi:hypothetical protein
MVDRRTLRVAGWYGAAIVAVAAGAVAIRVWAPLGSGFVSVASLALVAVVLVMAGQAWRGTDEAAREAHKVAWFWGGSFGALATFTALATLHLFGVPRLEAIPFPAGARPNPLFWMMLGAAVLVLGQGAGYALAWAGWWLKRR